MEYFSGTERLLPGTFILKKAGRLNRWLLTMAEALRRNLISRRIHFGGHVFPCILYDLRFHQSAKYSFEVIYFGASPLGRNCVVMWLCTAKETFPHHQPARTLCLPQKDHNIVSRGRCEAPPCETCVAANVCIDKDGEGYIIQ